MRRRFLKNMTRMMFVTIIVVASIVTLNYGLENGLNPPIYPRRDIIVERPLSPAPGLLGPNWAIALGLLALGLFILSETIFGSETKNVGDYKSSLVSASKEHRAAYVRMKRRRVQGREVRVMKRVRP